MSLHRYKRDNPFVRIKPPRIPARRNPPFSDAEQQRLLASQNPKTLLGLRVGEAASLQRAQVNWQQERITVIGKGDKQRTVPLGVTALRALDRYLRARDKAGQGGPWLWRSAVGGRLTSSGIYQVHWQLGKTFGFHSSEQPLRPRSTR